MKLNDNTKSLLVEWAEKYNDIQYFEEDPIYFPRLFAQSYIYLLKQNNTKVEQDNCKDKQQGNTNNNGYKLQDIEIAAIFASHFAWGRRAMIVRDCYRLFEEMKWKPYEYVMAGDWRDDNTSIHRTIKWKDVAVICARLKSFYTQKTIVKCSEDCDMEPFVPQEPISLENLSVNEIRVLIFGQKEDKKAANKKINMMRRWLVRDDGKVDLGVWKNTLKTDLLIPLDIHVHSIAQQLGLTQRAQKNLTTAQEITDIFKELFPSDPCKGDFALFGYGITHPKK